MTGKKPTKLDFARDVDFSDILTNPILDIAARFWEKDRYKAFRVCYRSMRRIDDLVDHRKESSNKITEEEIAVMERGMLNWLESVRRGDSDDQFTLEFLSILKRFRIPLWPWERLHRSMVYDLKHDGFSSFLVFVRYTEGAAIAPASIFMHLCGLNRTNGDYILPGFDIRLAARPLALFSYLVHIMRDFQKDQLAGLNYFSDRLLEAYGLSRKDLRLIAEGASVTDGCRRLMARYHSFAEYYRKRARAMVKAVSPFLAPRYQLSVELIYQLYLQIFELIDPVRGGFSADELTPSPTAISDRIQNTITGFRPVSQ